MNFFTELLKNLKIPKEDYILTENSITFLVGQTFEVTVENDMNKIILYHTFKSKSSDQIFTYDEKGIKDAIEIIISSPHFN